MSDTDDNAPDFSNVDWDAEQKKRSIKSGPVSKVNIVSDLLGTIRSTKLVLLCIVDISISFQRPGWSQEKTETCWFEEKDCENSRCPSPQASSETNSK